MAFGLIPARGDWEYRLLDTASAATFGKGDAVTLDAGLKLRAYASTASSVVGIAMSHSTASLPPGKVLVAIPAPGCTAISDLTTGIVQSDLSIGKVVGLAREGNHVSYTSTVIGHASRHSALVTVVGPINSLTSQVEVAFLMSAVGFYGSNSSATYAS